MSACLCAWVSGWLLWAKLHALQFSVRILLNLTTFTLFWSPTKWKGPMKSVWSVSQSVGHIDMYVCLPSLIILDLTIREGFFITWSSLNVYRLPATPVLLAYQLGEKLPLSIERDFFSFLRSQSNQKNLVLELEVRTGQYWARFSPK